MGFLGDIIGSVFGGGSGGESSQKTSQTVQPMKRPDEFQKMFDEFMGNYLGTGASGATASGFDEAAYLAANPDVAQFIQKDREHREEAIRSWGSATGWGHYQKYGKAEGRQGGFPDSGEPPAPASYKDMLQTAYDEEAIARQQYVDTATGAFGTHSGLLSDIIGKQMSGEAVGPYGADIDNLLASDPRVDKLLGERMGISFGGGNPMQFITGAQQRLIGSLLANQSTNLKTLTGAQTTGIQNLSKMSAGRAMSDIAPSQLAHELFQPSVQPQISYLNDLWGKIQPMEQLRYTLPSTTTKQTQTPSGTSKTSDYLNLVGLGKSVWDMFT